MDRHILLGGWLEQPLNGTQVGYGEAMGENIYWNLAGTVGDPSNQRADYNVIRAHGMHASAPNTTANSGSETVMYDGSDESDMNFGAGSRGWQNNGTSNQSACVPPGSKCGYSVDGWYYYGSPKPTSGPSETPHPINWLAVHQGNGKGALFWDDRGQAAKFMDYSDVESADSYWITDPDLQVPSQGGCALLRSSRTACGGGSGSGLTLAQAELPANYAYNVTRLENLDAVSGKSRPVVGDVETGCLFSHGSSGYDKCSTPPQFTAAAWHSLIAGARGIVWVQHNFSGRCLDDHTFIDGSDPSSPMYGCQQTPGVTLHEVVRAVSAFDHEVAGLNDALLSPTADGYAGTSADVSTMAKVYGGSCYVFAGSGRPATPPPSDQSVKFTLADRYTGPVRVYNESRTIEARNGTFSDRFADANSVHIYRISAGGFCSGTPEVTGVSLRPAAFTAATATALGGATGATISYRDSAPATTTFVVQRLASGMRRGRRCAPGGATPGRGCVRLVPVGTFTHGDGVGANHLRITGRVGLHAFPPGRYRLVVTPGLGGGDVGQASTVPFAIVS